MASASKQTALWVGLIARGCRVQRNWSELGDLLGSLFGKNIEHFWRWRCGRLSALQSLCYLKMKSTLCPAVSQGMQSTLSPAVPLLSKDEVDSLLCSLSGDAVDSLPCSLSAI